MMRPSAANVTKKKKKKNKTMLGESSVEELGFYCTRVERGVIELQV